MKNTAVYVSNLAPTCTANDLHRHMSKAGIIKDDMVTGEPRIRLYGDNDALVVYLREESVQLAVTLLDESGLCDSVIRVEPASFDPSSKPGIDGDNTKQRLDKETWRRRMEKMTSKLAWQDDQYEAVRSVEKRLKYECTCLLYNMITRGEVEEDAGLLLEVEEDVREEAKKWGAVRSVTVLPSLSLVAVRFVERRSAVDCLQIMQGRFYNGRRISACLYDGSFKLRDQQDMTGDFMPSDNDELE